MPRVFIESFSSASLLTVRGIDPTIPLVQLFSGGPAPTPGQLDQVRSYASAIGVAKGDVTSALLGAAHERCLVVHPYVVDDSDEMQSLLAMGVDGIFTDRPDRLKVAVGKVTPRTDRCTD